MWVALGMTVAGLSMAADASAEATTKPSPAAARRAQVVAMKPIVARPMRPNALVEIERRRMALPTRGTTGFVHRIGDRVGRAPF